MSEFLTPWLGLSSVLNELQFMTWWQSDSFKAWTHQNFSRQLIKRKGYEEQHILVVCHPLETRWLEHRIEASCLLALLLLTEEMR